MSFAYNNMINVIGDIMAQYKIAVDAGHGGSDYGATYNGRAEKDDNLKLALAVGDILEKMVLTLCTPVLLMNMRHLLKKRLMPMMLRLIILFQSTEIHPLRLTSTQAWKLLFTIIPVLNHRWLPISIPSWKRLALKILELPNVLTLLYSNVQKCLPYL